MDSSCRLCLSESVGMISVFELKDGTRISELVELICCVKINREEMFSKVICEICLDTITRAYQLRLLSIRNDRSLKERYLSNDVVVKTEIEDETNLKTEEGDGNCTEITRAEPAIEDTYYCDKCLTVETTKKQIEFHIVQEHVTGHACPVCFKKLCSPTILKQHVQRQHSAQVLLQCDQCNEILKTRKKLTLHLDVHKFFSVDETKTFTCQLCHISFSQDELNKMLRHINYHKRRVDKHEERKRTRDDSASLVCPHCGKKYRTKQILQQHIKRHFDSGDKYKCPKCPQKFKSWGELFYHNAVHTTERNFTCETCSKRFKTKRDLRNHRIRHETKDVKTFQCPHCQIFLKSRYTLNRHIRIHTGEKPFSCTYCEKSFNQKNELNKHLRIHIGECTYRCEEPGCTEAFRLLAELRLHQEKHYSKVSKA